jgi:hypothetical protein
MLSLGVTSGRASVLVSAVMPVMVGAGCSIGIGADDWVCASAAVGAMPVPCRATSMRSMATKATRIIAAAAIRRIGVRGAGVFWSPSSEL